MAPKKGPKGDPLQKLADQFQSKIDALTNQLQAAQNQPGESGLPAQGDWQTSAGADVPGPGFGDPNATYDPTTGRFIRPGLHQIRYHKGDEMAPASYPIQYRAEIQRQLRQAGFLTSQNAGVDGQWDSATALAYAHLLATANAQGQDWQSVLGAAITATNVEGNRQKALAKPPPLIVHLTNPDELRAIAQGVARKIGGGNLSEGDLQFFTQMYQGRERDKQFKEYAARYAGGPAAQGEQTDPNTGLPISTTSSGQTVLGRGGEVTDVPTSEAGIGQAFEELYKKIHPGQAQATAMGQQEDAVFQELANRDLTGKIGYGSASTPAEQKPK